MSVQLRFHDWPDCPALVWDGWCVYIADRMTDDEHLVMHQVGDDDQVWHGAAEVAQDVPDRDVTWAVQAMVRMRRAGALTEQAMDALSRVVRPFLADRYIPYEVREADGLTFEEEP